MEHAVSSAALSVSKASVFGSRYKCAGLCLLLFTGPVDMTRKGKDIGKAHIRAETNTSWLRELRELRAPCEGGEPRPVTVESE